MSRFAWILLLLPSVATALSAQEFRGQVGALTRRSSAWTGGGSDRVSFRFCRSRECGAACSSAKGSRSRQHPPQPRTARPARQPAGASLSPQRVGARRAAGPPSGFSARPRARRNRRALPPAASPLSVGLVDSGTRLAACLRIGLAGRGLFLLLLLAPQVGAMVLFLAAAGLAQLGLIALAVGFQELRAARAAT